MSSGSPISVGCPTVYNVAASSSTASQSLASPNSIINLTSSVPTLTLTLTSIKYPSFTIINITNATMSPSITLTIFSSAGQLNIVTAQSVTPSDQITITYPQGSSATTTPAISIGSQSVYNHLITDFIPSGERPSAATNPLITNSQLTTELPSALESLLDDGGSTPLGEGNLLVTTDNLAADLTPYLPPGGYQITNTGNNKLVTTQGTANLMTTFFGTLSTNPGILSAIASGIIANNNLTSIDIVNGSPFSLIESIVIPAAGNFELYSDSNPASSPIADVNDIKISENAILSIVADFKTSPPTGATQTARASIVGNLLGSPISTSNATNITYGLINGSFFTNSFSSSYVDANGDPVSSDLTPSLVINLTDPSTNSTYSTSTGGGARTSITSANVRFNMAPTPTPPSPTPTPTPAPTSIPVNVTFPCNAYGAITSFNNSNNNTVPSNASPPVIIDAMLPLFNELAVASGLVFSNVIQELKDLLQSLNNGYGNLSALTNYLQSHSENIHVVGKYESAIAINGNSLPIGYTYYNGQSSIGITNPVAITPPTSGIWTTSSYTPVSSTNTYTLIGTGSPASINLASATTNDFVGINSSQGLQLYDENDNLKNAVVYPMTNTIIVPSSYVGFGQISASTTGNCYPFPPYQLTINLNYLNAAIVYPPPSTPSTTDTYPSTDYSNGSVIQPGTMVKIYNESNYVVQVIARNFLYPSITSATSLPTVQPVPMAPFTAYYDASPSTATTPPVNTDIPAPTGWPTTTNYVNPSPSPSTYSINLRDTTSDVIYVKAKDSITLVFSSSNGTTGLPGSWGYI